MAVFGYFVNGKRLCCRVLARDTRKSKTEIINYFKISSNAPSNLLCNGRNFIFYFASAVFRCLSNDIALKGFLLQHCVVFLLLFCVAIVISELFFAGAYFRLDFAAIRWKKFEPRYF